MVVSRNHGVTWHRVANRSIFLDRGPAKSYDGGGVYPVPFVTEGDQHLIYYTASDSDHGSGKAKWSVGLSTLRRDGFVSLDCNSGKGELITHPFAIEGSSLRINAEILNGGHIDIAIENGRGDPIDGFEKSERITEGGLDVQVEFTESDLSKLESARLRFSMQNARLYSFWIKG